MIFSFENAHYDYSRIRFMSMQALKHELWRDHHKLLGLVGHLYIYALAITLYLKRYMVEEV